MIARSFVCDCGCFLVGFVVYVVGCCVFDWLIAVWVGEFGRYGML